MKRNGKILGEGFLAGCVVAWLVVLAGCGDQPANLNAPPDREAIAQTPNADRLVEPGDLRTVWQRREGNVITISARMGDPFTNPFGFEADAVGIDWELPDRLEVVACTFGDPVPGWDHSGWRAYVHPTTFKRRVVAIAARGLSGAELAPGQEWDFVRVEVSGPGIFVRHSDVPGYDSGLIDGFEGYTSLDAR